ncbi:MAG TPA: glycosyltransferase family 4 protein [Rudaea sp.]|nr:glycosyltransferase family 4 protein [Rudaea sp.]
MRNIHHKKSTSEREQKDKVYRVAILNSHPIQYFAPLYSFLNKKNIEIVALYCSDYSMRGAVDPGFGREVKWDIDLLQGYTSVFLGAKARHRVPAGFFSLICPEVWREVAVGKFDAIILHGHQYAVNVVAFLAAKFYQVPVFVKTDTHLLLKKVGWRKWIRDRVLKYAYKLVDGFLAIGTENRRYYKHLGVPEERIFHVPFAVDNDRFKKQSQLSEEKKTDIREKYGVKKGRFVVLFASKLVPGKHPELVLQAIASLNAEGANCTALLLGSGQMERELRELAKTCGSDGVVFAGFVNQSDLPGVFSLADVFVLPTDNEAWGLVVNEAMCAGLPVIVSNLAGCVVDLVTEKNGIVITVDSAASLTSALRQLIRDDVKRREMGRHSLRIIDDWSYEQCYIGLEQALRRTNRETLLT